MTWSELALYLSFVGAAAVALAGVLSRYLDWW